MERTSFLAGMLIGAVLLSAVWIGVDLYTDLNERLSMVEGYLRQLDAMLRQGGR